MTRARTDLGHFPEDKVKELNIDVTSKKDVEKFVNEMFEKILYRSAGKYSKDTYSSFIMRGVMTPEEFVDELNNTDDMGIEMKKRIREMTDDELVQELIETSHQLGEWSMEVHNPGSLNKIEQIRYDNVKREILDRMNSEK